MFYLYVCKYCSTSIPGTHRTQKRVWFPGIGTANGCELPHWCWEKNLSSAEAGSTLNHWHVSTAPLIICICLYLSGIMYEEQNIKKCLWSEKIEALRRRCRRTLNTCNMKVEYKILNCRRVRAEKEMERWGKKALSRWWTKLRIMKMS